jgi:hypothetical protein
MNFTTATLTTAELERLLLAADPGVVFAPPRILRRVIKHHAGVGGLGLQVPHRKSYTLGRDALLAIAGRTELGVAPDRTLPEVVVLLPRPDAGKLASRPRDSTLRKYARLLFHARVHVTLQQRRRDGALDDAAVRDRVRRLGFTEFAEARAVLRQEHFLLPPGDDATAYEEFAALFLELRQFDPDKLPRFFPSMEIEAAERVIAEDVNAEVLLAPLSPEYRGEGRAFYSLSTGRGVKRCSTKPILPRRKATAPEPRSCALGRRRRRLLDAHWMSPSCIFSGRCVSPMTTKRCGGAAWRRCSDRRRTASGRSRPGCCSICKKSASITNAPSTPPTWSSGSSHLAKSR